MNRPYQVCTRCIMDTTDPQIVFDERGVCNHCRQYDERAILELRTPNEQHHRLDALVGDIKASGHGKEYDCILGVSGGVDSSYVAYLAKQLGLRPLAVHFDNGWNSELAVDNIKRVLSSLDIDLYTYVVDWDEFRDLQMSFLKASVPNAEIPTDHAINALLWNHARKNHIKYILSGSNVKTEGIMPLSWTYSSLDLYHIHSIQHRFGTKTLKTLPRLGLHQFAYYVFVLRLRMVNLLDFFDYDKAEAIKTLEDKLGWRPYPEKHHESVWTRFYQGDYLVTKFGYDKRLPHLSTLIASEQISRQEALRRLGEDTYPDALRRQDHDFILKKFGLSKEEYEYLLKLPIKSHLDYPNLNMFYLRSSSREWFKRIAKAS